MSLYLNGDSYDVTPKMHGDTVIFFGHFKAINGSHSQSKNDLYFPNIMFLELIFPILLKYFQNAKENVAS